MSTRKDQKTLDDYVGALSRVAARYGKASMDSIEHAVQMRRRAEAGDELTSVDFDVLHDINRRVDRARSALLNAAKRLYKARKAAGL